MLTALSNARPPETKDALSNFPKEQLRLGRIAEYQKQIEDRDAFIMALAEKGTLRFGSLARGPDGKPLPSVIQAEVINDVMKLRNTFNLLHIAEVD